MAESRDDVTPPAEGDPATDPQRGFGIHKIYVKDLSFENPRAPEVFRTEWSPQLEINIESNASQVEGPLYEVVLTATVTAKQGEQVGFLVEVQQAGLFEVRGVGNPELARVLAGSCPTILYPYLRETVSTVVGRGGFPHLQLAPANFEALYEARLREAEAQAGGGA